MKAPTISVVIPAHNAAHTIVACLDSVISQTHPVTEIIVVDDASTDQTLTCVEDWIRTRGQKITTIPLSQNGGPAASRNTGIEAAKGEWIAFLDADDAWFKWRLEIQIAILQAHPDAILLCGQTTELTDAVDAKQKKPEHIPIPHELTLLQLISHNPVATSTVLARRDTLLERKGFDTTFRGPEDYDLWLRMVAIGTCLYIPLVLSKYRATVGSLSMDDRTFLPQVLRVLDKAFSPQGVLWPYRHFRFRAKAQQYTSASWMAYNRGDRKRARKLLLRSWLCGPARLAKEKDDPLQRVKLLIRYCKKGSTDPVPGN